MVPDELSVRTGGHDASILVVGFPAGMCSLTPFTPARPRPVLAARSFGSRWERITSKCFSPNDLSRYSFVDSLFHWGARVALGDQQHLDLRNQGNLGQFR